VHAGDGGREVVEAADKRARNEEMKILRVFILMLSSGGFVAVHLTSVS